MKPEQSVNVRQDIERGRVHPGHDVLQEGLSGLHGSPSKVRNDVSTLFRSLSDLAVSGADQLLANPEVQYLP